MLRKHGSFFACSAMAMLALLALPISVDAQESYLNAVPIPIPATPLSLDPADETQMITDVNTTRAAAGLAPLTRDPKLASIARAYAHDMASRRYFGHRNPEGQDIGNRLVLAGVPYQYAGENIAFVQNENEAMTGFLNSSGHRANILSNRYTRIGIGVVMTDGYGAVYVQEFSDGDQDD